MTIPSQSSSRDGEMQPEEVESQQTETTRSGQETHQASSESLGQGSYVDGAHHSSPDDDQAASSQEESISAGSVVRNFDSANFDVVKKPNITDTESKNLDTQNTEGVESTVQSSIASQGDGAQGAKGQDQGVTHESCSIWVGNTRAYRETAQGGSPDENAAADADAADLSVSSSQVGAGNEASGASGASGDAIGAEVALGDVAGEYAANSEQNDSWGAYHQQGVTKRLGAFNKAKGSKRFSSSDTSAYKGGRSDNMCNTPRRKARSLKKSITMLIMPFIVVWSLIMVVTEFQMQNLRNASQDLLGADIPGVELSDTLQKDMLQVAYHVDLLAQSMNITMAYSNYNSLKVLVNAPYFHQIPEISSELDKLRAGIDRLYQEKSELHFRTKQVFNTWLAYYGAVEHFCILTGQIGAIYEISMHDHSMIMHGYSTLAKMISRHTVSLDKYIRPQCDVVFSYFDDHPEDISSYVHKSHIFARHKETESAHAAAAITGAAANINELSNYDHLKLPDSDEWVHKERRLAGTDINSLEAMAAADEEYAAENDAADAAAVAASAAKAQSVEEQIDEALKEQKTQLGADATEQRVGPGLGTDTEYDRQGRKDASAIDSAINSALSKSYGYESSHITSAGSASAEINTDVAVQTGGSELSEIDQRLAEINAEESIDMLHQHSESMEYFDKYNVEKPDQVVSSAVHSALMPLAQNPEIVEEEEEQRTAAADTAAINSADAAAAIETVAQINAHTGATVISIPSGTGEQSVQVVTAPSSSRGDFNTHLIANESAIGGANAPARIKGINSNSLSRNEKYLFTCRTYTKAYEDLQTLFGVQDKSMRQFKNTYSEVLAAITNIKQYSNAMVKKPVATVASDVVAATDRLSLWIWFMVFAVIVSICYGYTFVSNVFVKPTRRLLELVKEFSDTYRVPDPREVSLREEQEIIATLQPILHNYGSLVQNNIDLKRLNTKLGKLYYFDGLTHLYNRQALEEISAQIPMLNNNSAIVLLDIDHLFDYNVARGRLAGDDAIALIASTIKSNIAPERDLLFRYSGDEFCLVLSQISYHETIMLCDHLLQKIETLQLKYRTSLGTKDTKLLKAAEGQDPMQAHQAQVDNASAAESLDKERSALGDGNGLEDNDLDSAGKFKAVRARSKNVRVLTISIGVSYVDENMQHKTKAVKEHLEFARQALHLAKLSGESSFHVYEIIPDLQTDAPQRDESDYEPNEQRETAEHLARRTVLSKYSADAGEEAEL